MDKLYFEYLMKKKGYIYETFAKEIGLCKVSLLNKVSGDQEFKLCEIRKVRDILEMSEEDLLKVFFV